MTAATSTPGTAASTRPSGPPGLRLQLDPTMAGTGAVDGGWWPRSRDPDAELPGLIAGLDASLGPSPGWRSIWTPGTALPAAWP